MRPKKKARLSFRAASTPSVDTPAGSTPVAGTKNPSKERDEASGEVEQQLLQDPWTDEQHISLFKGIIKWKPVGE